METSFLELKSKQVINTVDGKCLGKIIDIVFDVGTAKALGFVVPQNDNGFWSLFRSNKELFIPMDCVYKIGIDVILVELYIEENLKKPKPKPKNCGINYTNTQNNG